MENKITLCLLLAVFVLGSILILQNLSPSDTEIEITPEEGSLKDIKTFNSEQEFKNYLEESQSDSSHTYLGTTGSITAPRQEAADKTGEVGAPTGGDSGGEVPSRVSETNVQVEGIDEPDIVKTNGNSIFYSSDSYYSGETRVIDSIPVENLSIASKIDKRGKLFLKEDTLIIIPERYGEKKIYGYDISEPSSPQQKWEMEINGSIAGARLYQGNIYMVLADDIDYNHPCPIRPVISGGKEIVVGCSEIYYPSRPVETDVTYTALSFEPKNGNIKDKLTFVGSSSNSVVYMSKNAIYSTYTHREPLRTIMMDFIKENKGDLFPKNIVQKVEKLSEYDISDLAKATEMKVILQNYYNSLNKDKRLEMKTKFENAFSNYTKKHKRKFQETGIVKVSINEGSLELTDTGSVAGEPLDQFSIDEYKNDLRIATTIDPYKGESENDVYILNENLEVTGSVEGMGKTERIYSVRFINDKGYVVTFRRIDPFFVLDLSNPKKPEMKGKLKLPGYSSYLHPISKDKILGVGEEEAKVKIAMFDVSNPEKPKLKDTYYLDDYYSDIQSSHHAFLLDKKHKVFFLPGSKGGYIFSYGDNIELEKAISDIDAKRAIYIGDYMFIISEEEINVLNENKWKKVKNLNFEIEDERPPLYEKGVTKR